MPTTWEEAYDVMTDTLIAGLNGMHTAIGISVDPDVRFMGVKLQAGVPEIPKTAFVRFNMNPVLEHQSSLRNGNSGTMYTTSGVFILQCFMPKDDVKGEEHLRRFANAVKKVYRGNPLDGCVWARNMRVNKLDPEENFLRANVVGDYEYEEVG